MTSPTEYLEQCRLALITCQVVKKYQIVKSEANDRRGYIRVRATLVNDDFLEMAEYFVAGPESILTQDYRFQWMDQKQSVLRYRWDNTPHFPALPSFPHHVHQGDDTHVLPGKPMNWEKALAQITSILQQNPKVKNA